MKESKEHSRQFTRILMEWHDTANFREMPWKGEKDPYKIWLSEIMLQQTRVEQGVGYYLRFIQKYPTVHILAAASDSEVFKLWEGLGYYSRCRNLLFTARTIVSEFHGKFPADYHALLKLKGVGTYTASAIASFAFDLPYAVVDGNVLRILARYFGFHDPVNEPAGKQKLSNFAQSLINPSKPAAFNQAIMDFGATVCKPQNPDCHSCPLSAGCKAFLSESVSRLPVKISKAPRRLRYFVYFILRYRGKIWVRERVARDIWRHLSEFFLVEVKSKSDLSHQKISEIPRLQGWHVSAFRLFPDIEKQLLTHQEIKTAFALIDLVEKPILPEDGKWLKPSDFNKIAFPKTINVFLDKAIDGMGSLSVFSVK